MKDRKKPDPNKHKDIRIPEKDIRLDKEDSFKELLKKSEKGSSEK